MLCGLDMAREHVEGVGSPKPVCERDVVQQPLDEVCLGHSTVTGRCNGAYETGRSQCARYLDEISQGRSRVNLDKDGRVE
jgi:hypothetical protein